MTDKILVLVFPVGEKPKLAYVPDDLEQYQALVHGRLAAIYLPNNMIIYRNEHSDINGMELNFVSPQGGAINGPCFFMRTNADGDHVSLTPEDVQVYAPSLAKEIK